MRSSYRMVPEVYQVFCAAMTPQRRGTSKSSPPTALCPAEQKNRHPTDPKDRPRLGSVHACPSNSRTSASPSATSKPRSPSSPTSV